MHRGLKWGIRGVNGGLWGLFGLYRCSDVFGYAVEWVWVVVHCEGFLVSVWFCLCCLILVVFLCLTIVHREAVGVNR